jgi:hypothetical protein
MADSHAGTRCADRRPSRLTTALSQVLRVTFTGCHDRRVHHTAVMMVDGGNTTQTTCCVNSVTVLQPLPGHRPGRWTSRPGNLSAWMSPARSKAPVWTSSPPGTGASRRRVLTGDLETIALRITHFIDALAQGTGRATRRYASPDGTRYNTDECLADCAPVPPGPTTPPITSRR